MTYNVLTGTLDPTHSLTFSRLLIIFLFVVVIIASCGLRVERTDPLHFLAGCRKRWL